MDTVEVNEPIVSVDQSTLRYFREHIGQVVGFLIVFAVVEGGAIAGLIINSAGTNGTGNDNTPYMVFIILPIIALAVAYGYVHQRIQDEFFRQFAVANGYTFSPHGGNFGALDGTLFHLGYDQSVGDTVSGSYLGCPIALFIYSYVTGSGKQRQVHRYTVFQLQFDTVMPELLLEKKAIFSSDSLLGQLPEHIKLEGDFNKYFSLSIKKGYEVEALEVFTPDVMAELEEQCRDFSIEIVNDHLFVYDNTTVSTKAALDSLYAVAQYFVLK